MEPTTKAPAITATRGHWPAGCAKTQPDVIAQHTTKPCVSGVFLLKGATVVRLIATLYALALTIRNLTR